MPRPPRSPCEGVWGMGAKFCLYRALRRCWSIVTALLVLGVWLCLITVINLISDDSRSQIRVIRKDTILQSRGSYSDGLAKEGPRQMEGLSASVKRDAKLVRRNEARVHSLHDIRLFEKTAGPRTHPDGEGESGIIGGRRIQGIKLREMEGLERGAGKDKTKRGRVDRTYGMSKRSRIDTNALTRFEIESNSSPVDSSKPRDLPPNWIRHSQPGTEAQIASLDIAKHEKGEQQEEKSVQRSQETVSGHANQPFAKSPDDTKEILSSYEKSSIEMFRLQAGEKSISSHLDDSIARYPSSGVYEGGQTINDHYNGDEMLGAQRTGPHNSPEYLPEYSDHYLTSAKGNWDRTFNTRPMKTAPQKSNRRYGLAMQINFPERTDELPSHNSIDQSGTLENSKTLPSIKSALRSESSREEKEPSIKAQLSPPVTSGGSKSNDESTMAARTNTPSMAAANLHDKWPTGRAQGEMEDMAGIGAIKLRVDSFSGQVKAEVMDNDGFDLYSYNVTASDGLSLHRDIPDTRPTGCPLLKTYTSTPLPKATVVICAHNEALSVLLRTVHSVLDRTPPQLLDRVIIVDDYSSFHDMGVPLHDALVGFGDKVLLTRTKKREGLVRARLLGYSLATSEVLVFLDAHCECNLGWLEPLLHQLAINPRQVVSPYIDTIRSEDFHYKESPPNLQGGFNWRLEFGWRAATQRHRKTDHEPIRSPVISGGLFAVRKDFFTYLGTYDSELNVWGGENFEISFKTWMCGGSMFILPCSRVGHVFRASLPYSFQGHRESTVLRNLARIANVWMDDYASIFWAAVDFPIDLDIGDMSGRRQLRHNLSCKPFQWYLQEVFPELPVVKQDVLFHGMVKNQGSLLCLDIIDDVTDGHRGHFLELSSCRGDRKQIFDLTEIGELHQDGACVIPLDNRSLVLTKCDKANVWVYENSTLRLSGSDLCLTSVENEYIHLLPCTHVQTAVQSINHSIEQSVSQSDPKSDHCPSTKGHYKHSQTCNNAQHWTFEYSFNWKRRRRRQGV